MGNKNFSVSQIVDVTIIFSQPNRFTNLTGSSDLAVNDDLLRILNSLYSLNGHEADVWENLIEYLKTKPLNVTKSLVDGLRKIDDSKERKARKTSAYYKIFLENDFVQSALK